MKHKKLIIYHWHKINWHLFYVKNPFSGSISTHTTPLCPNPKCNCNLKKSKEKYSIGEYKYECINCDFKITLDKPIEEKTEDFISISKSFKFKNADIINIDGELIKVKNEHKSDDDYWVEVKISKNKKNEAQLMVLAGSRKSKDKAQLFIEPKNEKMTFDQNNDHPRHIFTKITATFRNSQSNISLKK